MKMTDFIIGVILAVTFMTAFGLIIANATTEYDVTYDPADIEVFEKMSDIQDLTAEIKEDVGNQTTDKSIYDVVGGFLSDAKNTLMIAAKSFTTFEYITGQGLGKMNVPPLFKIAMWSIVIVLLFIGVILGAVLGRRL